MELLHQYSAVASYEECVESGREGGGTVMVLGRAGLSQNRTVRWVGTKRHNGGPLDWPGSAGAHRCARIEKLCTSSDRISCSVCAPESSEARHQNNMSPHRHQGRIRSPLGLAAQR